MARLERGVAAIDVLVACGLVAIVVGIAMPAAWAVRDREAARLAARHLATRMQYVRLEALRRNVHVALRFDAADPSRFGVFADGDGDGVLQNDIDAGVDLRTVPDARLSDYFAGVTFRIRSDVPDPGGSGTLIAGSDPVRLGATNLLSFNPLGGSTSGSVYLAGRVGPQFSVRVLGSTGRVRVLWWDAVSRTWRQD